MEADLTIIDEVDSTNITVAEMADKGAPEGSCVISFYQRCGQGRSGRSFFSPKGGNLYMSLLLRPKDARQTGMITIAAASATVGAIRAVYGIDTGIKWVNDIIYNDRKVCGIIAQAHGLNGSDPYVILGIGINIYAAADVPEDIRGIYGSLFERTCDLAESDQREEAVGLAKEIINIFSSYYEDRSSERCIADYRKDCIVIGKEVEYVSGNKALPAKVRGITDDGAIELDINGSIRSYRDGEIRIRLKDGKSC